MAHDPDETKTGMSAGMPSVVPTPSATPTIRWFDSQERDLYLSQRRAAWAFDGRKR